MVTDPADPEMGAPAMVRVAASSTVMAEASVMVGALMRKESIWEVTWVVPVRVMVGGVRVSVVYSAVAAEAMVGAVPAARVRADIPEVVVLVSKVKYAFVPSVILKALLAALLAERRMLPVVEFPSCNVCAFVVPRTPVPVSVVALFPELAEILAVGVPEPIMLRTANLAEVVAVAPSKRSSVILNGDKAPEFLCQKLIVPPLLNHERVPEPLVESR